jgi:hypothetical protein
VEDLLHRGTRIAVLLWHTGDYSIMR